MNLQKGLTESLAGRFELIPVHHWSYPEWRQAFEILCGYPAQEVSYTTLLGQLQGRGNTDLVKHYLELYEGAFLFRGLSKYSGKIAKSRASSPKILPMCPALYTLAAGSRSFDDPEKRGHVFEAAVGMDLLRLPGTRLFYWRDGAEEVDFVLQHDDRLYAIEVKSGRRRSVSGLSVFQSRFKGVKTCLIRPDNYAAFAQSPMEFLQTMSLKSA